MNQDGVDAAPRDISGVPLVTNELYLFFAEERSGEPDSLWGVIDSFTPRGIRLESSSRDLRRFDKWRVLPPEYPLCRHATYAETLRYGISCGVAEERGQILRTLAEHGHIELPQPQYQESIP
ncbi:MAG: hypothetical protein J1E04_01265 [Alistipes sp.]|nr:hypothetical protein [Alistipes sp.]